MRAVRVMSLRDRSMWGRSPTARLRAIVVLAVLGLTLAACDMPGRGTEVDNVAQPDAAAARSQETALSATRSEGRRSPTLRRHRRTERLPTAPAPSNGGAGDESPEAPDEQPAADPASGAHGVAVSAATTGHGGQLERHPGGTISGDGVTLDGKDFANPVVVTGDNVTIRNSRFSMAAFSVLQVGKGRNTVIERNTITGGNRSLDSTGILVQGANKVTIRNNDISQHANGIRLVGSATIDGNYIHDLIPGGGGPHRDNIEVYGGAKNSSITGNRLVHQASETSPVNIAAWSGGIDNIRIERNFIDGGNCSITYDPYGNSYPTGVQFIGNVFGDNTGYKGCVFNFVSGSGLAVLAGTADAAVQSTNPRRYVWKNNVWGETGSGSKDGTTIGIPTR